MENTQPFAGVPDMPSAPQQPVLAPRLAPVGQVFKDAWSLFASRWINLLVLIAVPYLFLITGTIMSAVNPAVAALVMIIGYVLLIPAGVALVLMVAQQSSLGSVYRQGFGLFFPFLWLGVLSGFVVMGGMVMLIIPGIMMSVWFLFSGFTFVLEGKRGLTALLQSREYARDYWWPLFGRVLALYVPFMIIAGTLQAIVGKENGGVASMILSVLTTPFMIAYVYTMYRNLTSIKPALAASQPSSGRGFLITSGILGVFAVVIGIGFLFVVMLGVSSGKANMYGVPLYGVGG